jgi:phage terminase large subunit-like protein
MNLGTRWAKFDLIQHIIDNEPNTHHFEMSALTPDDQAVYPERFSRAILREIEEEQGTYIFSSQYLNNPYDPASMIFQPEWLHTWDKLPEGMRLVIMVDPAISQEKSACFSVVCVLGAWDQQLYVVDYHRGRYNPSELIDHMFSLSAQYNVMDVAVETVAWQQALAHFFNAECTRRGTFLNVIETKPGAKETKDMRIRGLQPFAQRGALHLAAWMRDLKKEMLDYPFSKTLDIVDAVGYGPRLLGIAYTRAKEQHVPDVHTGLTMGELVDSLRRKGTTRWGMHVGRMPVR